MQITTYIIILVYQRQRVDRLRGTRRYYLFNAPVCRLRVGAFEKRCYCGFLFQRPVAKENYRQTSNIRGTKSQNLNVSGLILQLFLPSPFKSGLKSVEHENVVGAAPTGDSQKPNIKSIGIHALFRHHIRHIKDQRNQSYLVYVLANCLFGVNPRLLLMRTYWKSYYR